MGFILLVSTIAADTIVWGLWDDVEKDKDARWTVSWVIVHLDYAELVIYTM
jgi:hypothetical protein